MTKRLLDRVVGHREVLQRLRTLASSGRLPQSLLFVGPSGVGKKLAAKAIAQVLVCTAADRPCGECGPCRRVANEQSESLLVVEPTQGAIRAEQAREVIESINMRSLGRARAVIFDDAHRFNPQSANALLKSLEEPPPETYFILISPSLEAVLPTLRSRMQVIRFAGLSMEELRTLYPEAPDWLLESARGQVDTLEALADERAETLRNLAIQIWNDMLAGEREKACETLRSNAEKKDVSLLCRLMLLSLRDGWTARYGCEGRASVQGFSEMHDEVLSAWAKRLVAVAGTLERHAEPFLAMESFILNSSRG